VNTKSNNMPALLNYPAFTTKKNALSNQKTFGLTGLVSGVYYRATLLKTSNKYLKCPCEVEVHVWEFGTDNSWITFTVQVIGKNGNFDGSAVLAHGCKFYNVKQIQGHGVFDYLPYLDEVEKTAHYNTIEQ